MLRQIAEGRSTSRIQERCIPKQKERILNTRKTSFITALLLLLSFPVYARNSSGVDESSQLIVGLSKLPSVSIQKRLDAQFHRWETYTLDLPALERQARREGRIDLLLGTRRFELELELNNLRAPNYRRVVQTASGSVEEKPSPVATYRGSLRGDPESAVRLLIQPGFLQGFIETADEILFIDPVMKYVPDIPASEVVVFDQANVKADAEVTCGVGEIAHQVDDLRRHLRPSTEKISSLESAAEEATLSPTTLKRFDISTEADYEYYTKYRGSTFSQIEGILNQVEWIYRRDLGMTLRIQYQSLWGSEDPYTADDPATLLAQFQDRWNTNRYYFFADVAHLFTGKQANFTIGYAYLGVVCNPTSSYGISWDLSGIVHKIVAHEIGHNFNAIHDDEASPQPPEAADCPKQTGPIMCHEIQFGGSERFSSLSKTTIGGFVSTNGSCLDSLPLRSIFTSQTPADTVDTGGVSYEVATQFSSSQDGYIVALRIWKASGDNGVHRAKLWTDTGTQLADVLVENESASGWQEVYLPRRVAITAGTRYRVSFNNNIKHAKTFCGLQPPITNGPLTAWQGFYSGPNGHYTFPTNASCSNFFADVYFIPK